MSIYGINSNNAYSMEFWQQQKTDGSSYWNSSVKAAASSTSSSTSSTYSTSSSTLVEQLTEALKVAMDTLGLSSKDRITFTSLALAKSQLEDEFASAVKEGLLELGLDEDVQFTLVTDGKGGIKVICDDDETKAAIEQFFKDNPELVDQFNQIQALTNLEEARKNLSINPAETRKRIQMESLVAWFADTGQSVDQMMMYSSSESLFAAVGIHLTA